MSLTHNPILQSRQETTLDRLDLVENIFEHYAIPDLKNIILIGAQHILPSTEGMLNSFFDRGMSPNNVFLIGKCYSTDQKSYESMVARGVYICHSSLEFNKDIPFDVSYSINVREFTNKILEMIPSTPHKRIVVVDDGGEMIYHLTLQAKKKNLTFSCVEQTTSGYRKFMLLNLEVGIMNVARSKAKLTFESKIVAKTASRELRKKIFFEQHRIENVLIFGNGAIGNAVSNSLEGTFNITLTDIDPEKTNIPLRQCLENLSDFDFIIGCTGQRVLSTDNLDKLKQGAILASLSSSDREFDITKERKKVPSLSSCHSDFQVSRARILNCGFPINFNGIASSVDIEEFELTRALLTLGILEAMKLGTRKGIFPLPMEGEAFLIRKFLQKYPYYA